VIHNFILRLIVTTYAYIYFKQKFYTEPDNERLKNPTDRPHVTLTGGAEECSTATKDTQKSSLIN
jgi:hypothetical protein